MVFSEVFSEDHLRPQPMRRYPELDGLRAIAIALVVLYHLKPFIPESHGLLRAVFGTGWNGVYLFFVLSGFLIGTLAFSETDRTDSLDVQRFWMRRILRTWPLYFVLLPVNYLRALDNGLSISPPIWQYLTFTQNLSEVHFFGPTWSLAVEEQFYFVLPLVVLGVVRSSVRTRWAVGLVVAGLLAPWIARMAQGLGSQLWIVMDSLVVGIAVGLLKRYRPEAFARTTRWPNLLFLAGVVAVYAPFVLTDGTRVREVVILGGQAVGFGLVMMAALSGRLALRSALSSRPAYFVALTSYSIYLTHGDPVFWVGRWATQATLSPTVQSGVVVAGGLLGSVVVGAILYYLVERPGMRIRDRYFPRR